MSGEKNWEGEVYFSFDKSTSFVLVKERGFRGTRFVDIREWRDRLDPKATQKGITIPYEQVAPLASALASFAQKL